MQESQEHVCQLNQPCWGQGILVAVLAVAVYIASSLWYRQCVAKVFEMV